MIRKLQPLYNKLRPHLLKYDLFTTWQILHSVPVRNACIFDTGLVNPDYKPGLATAVTEYVNQSDYVLEVGGGRGVMTVLAARNGDRVMAFEPAKEMRELLMETVRASMVGDRVTVEASVIGSLEDLMPIFEDGYGKPKNMNQTSVLPPSDLPECDVLLMDCEGGEEQIITEMKIKPETVIYESHPDRANPHDLNSVLKGRGYRLVSNRAVQSDTDRQVYVLEYNDENNDRDATDWESR